MKIIIYLWAWNILCLAEIYPAVMQMDFPNGTSTLDRGVGLHPGDTILVETSGGTFSRVLANDLSFPVVAQFNGDYLMIRSPENAPLAYLCWGEGNPEKNKEAQKAGLWHGSCVDFPGLRKRMGILRLHRVYFSPLRKEYYFWDNASGLDVSGKSKREEKRSFRRENIMEAPFYSRSFSLHTTQGKQIAFPGWENLPPGIYLVYSENRVYLFYAQ